MVQLSTQIDITEKHANELKQNNWTGDENMLIFGKNQKLCDSTRKKKIVWEACGQVHKAETQDHQVQGLIPSAGHV